MLLWSDTLSRPELADSAVYLPLKNIQQQAVSYLVSIKSNPYFQNIHEVSKYANIFLICCALLILYLTAYTFTRIIIHPLNIIQQTLNMHDNERIHLLAENKNEFGTVARLIIEFFEQRTQLKVEIEQRKRQEEELKYLNAELSQQKEEVTVQAEHLLKANEDIRNRTKEIIEQKKQIEEQNKELQLQRDKYHLLNVTKDKFFSIIAHDLRSPFNALIGFTDILINDYNELTSSEKIDLLQVISSSSKETHTLLDNLLHWVRSQTEGIKHTPEQFNVSEVIQHTLNLLRSSAAQKSIALSAKINTSLMVYADKNMISTIIRNLITNAIKFTPENGKIHVECKNLMTELEFTVADNGVGMTPEMLGKIFKIEEFRFSQGTGRETGTGLGLMVCREFVEKHGGTIWADSEVNNGSTFHFTIPI